MIWSDQIYILYLLSPCKWGINETFIRWEQDEITCMKAWKLFLKDNKYENEKKKKCMIDDAKFFKVGVYYWAL